MSVSTNHHQSFRVCLTLLCGMNVVLALPVMAAQSGAKNAAQHSRVSTDTSGKMEEAAIQARIASVTARTDIPEPERELVLQQLRAAATSVEAAETAHKTARGYADTLQSAPETIAALNAESLSPPAEAQAGNISDDPVQMQLELASLQAEAVSLRSKLRSLEESLRNMANRPDEARTELADLHRQLEQQQATIPANASQLQLEARNLLNNATRQELAARIDKTEQELLSLPTRESITTAQHALTARRSTQVDAALVTMNERITAQRQQEAEKQAKQAQEFVQQLAGQPAALRDYADRNAQIRESRKHVNERLIQARAAEQELRTQYAEVSEARRNAEQILAIGRISEESGRLLRQLQAHLLAHDRLQVRITSREDAIVDAQVERLKYRQDLRALEPPKRVAKHYLDTNAVADTKPNLTLMTTLIERRSAALSDLDEAQGQLIAVLAEAKALDSQFMRENGQLRSLLDEHLLWLPSTAAFGSVWLRQLGRGVVWLLAPANWSSVPSTVVSKVRAHWFTVIAWLAVLIALFVTRRRLVSSLQTLALPVGSRDDRFLLTLAACAVTLLLALAWPVAIAAAGWVVRSASDPGSFASALGRGLTSLAIVWFMLDLFINMCRPHGVFAGHFAWGEHGTQRLSRSLRLLLLMIAPTALVVGMTHASGQPELVDGIGRLGFVIGSLALALFLHRVFRMRGGALTGGLRREGLAMRTRHVWSRVLVAIPLLLAVLAGTGYYATARELQNRLFTSGWIMLAVVIAFFVAMRGVVVASRRSAWQQLDEQRAKALAEAAENTGADDSSDELTLQNREPEIDAVKVNQQTRALLRATSGIVLLALLWSIWSSLIPALNVFNDVALWSHLVGTASGAKVAVITLGDILLSLLIFVLAIIAARNLPGFLEVTLLQNLRIDAGTRYAVGTIGRYVIIGIGLVTAFSRIGVEWSQLQWIVAALGVGLGFGLQEIVANFISGLIILFERPVRVGDLVSIGPTTGNVSRIRIRAITITDFDNLEVIVPNKAFITETVQNWSLTNEVTRLLIVVHVAYGSDVEQAQQIILGVASDNPHVLTSPAPSAWFLRFGENALEFELRAYVNTIDERLPTRHALHAAIDVALRGAGIEIPFPQRDVHVRYTDTETPRD